MDRNEAIRAHAEWKMRLAVYLGKPDGSLKAWDVAKDDACPLGKWIVGEGRTRFAMEPAFQRLQVAHSEFHKNAGDVIRRADQGEAVSEEMALGADSDFARTSSEIVATLMTLPIE